MHHMMTGVLPTWPCMAMWVFPCNMRWVVERFLKLSDSIAQSLRSYSTASERALAQSHTVTRLPVHDCGCPKAMVWWVSLSTKCQTEQPDQATKVQARDQGTQLRTGRAVSMFCMYSLAQVFRWWDPGRSISCPGPYQLHVQTPVGALQVLPASQTGSDLQSITTHRVIKR